MSLPIRAAPLGDARTTYTGISASGDARQHNGNVINHYANSYSLRQRRSDETLREDQRSPPLLEAAAEGQTARVDYLLRLGVNLDYSDDDGFTALHHASLSGFEDTVRTLVDAGANVNASGPDCGTPICLAALKARLDICSLLLSRRARTKGPSTGESANVLESALHCAVIGNDDQCIRLFLDAGCDINEWCALSANIKHPVFVPPFDEIRKSLSNMRHAGYMLVFQPLQLALMSRNAAVSGLLVAAGAALNDHGPPSQGRSQIPLNALMVSISCGNIEGVKQLIGHGADLELKDANSNMTPLMCAAYRGNMECIKLLIDAGVNVDRGAGMRESALDAAIFGRHEEVALMLLRNGATFGPGPSGFTALDSAVSNGLETVAHELASLGATLLQDRSNSYTPIRLLNVQTLEYHTFGFFAGKFRPPAYAVLTHRWQRDELLFRRFSELSVAERKAHIDSSTAFAPCNSDKIASLCALCRQHDIEWAFSDSLCISHTDNREEAPLYMFSWLRNAAKHFIYLYEVVAGSDSAPPKVGLDRRFQWSWFLQELLANTSESTLFYDKDWHLLGSRQTLAQEISSILDIRPEHLHDFQQACVAAKLSWGSRLTTISAREDRAYAMIGILGVSMDLRYGEGEFRAFRRLQEAIVDTYNDESIFAWGTHLQAAEMHTLLRTSDADKYLLAPSIDAFAGCADMHATTGERRFRVLRDDQGTAQSLEALLPAFNVRPPGLATDLLNVDLRCYRSTSEGSRYSVGLFLLPSLSNRRHDYDRYRAHDAVFVSTRKSSLFRPTKERKPMKLNFPLDTERCSTLFAEQAIHLSGPATFSF